jgi:type 1 glutamine amidotransferase
MTNKIDSPFADGISRRRFLGTAAGAAALAALPSELAAQDINWRLGCQYTTGGAPYRPAFAAMFLDPLFMELEVITTDLNATSSPPIMSRAAAAGQGSGRAGAAAGGRQGGRGGAAAGAGAPATPGALPPSGNAPLNIASNMPLDIPVIPSGTGIGVGVMTLTHFSVSVVLINDQTDWETDRRQTIETAFNGNQELLGVVVFHNAIGDNQRWPLWYQELAGGLLVLNDHDGMKKTTVSKAATFDVRPVGTHPIVQDVAPFKVTGEDAYKGMWQSPKITPLLEAIGPATDRVVAWVGPNPGKGRVVVIQPGTSVETLKNPAFRRLVRNSILWAGHRLD